MKEIGVELSGDPIVIDREDEHGKPLKQPAECGS